MQHISLLLKEQTATYKGRTVFMFKNKSTQKYDSINWTELFGLTNQVSLSLLNLGLLPHDKIGILSHNKPEWVISDLGIMGIRAVVVPLYATVSKNEIKYIVDETEMKLLFAGNQEQIEKAAWLADNCKSLQHIIVFEGSVPDDERFIHWEDFLNQSKQNHLTEQLDNIQKEFKEDDIATIIYTSGTTSEPKGVILGHDNFFSAFRINQERLQVSDKEKSLCFLPLSHVFERTWTLFLLYCGAINVFLENPRQVIDELPKVRPTLMCTVPRFFEKTYEGIQREAQKWPRFKQNIFNWSVKIGLEYIEYLKNAQAAPKPLQLKRKLADKLVLKKLRSIFGGNIKFMPCAGAAIKPNLLRFFHAAGIFINYGYGATETTATVSCFKSDIYNFDYCGSIMPETEVRISEENEILVKGNTVFKGYYNKPEATSQVLKEGWYYSGDEGYIVNNEYLAMTDRIKDLIKTSGGKYVSPQKIELLVGDDQYIEQIVVIGDNRKFITALIVPSFDLLEPHFSRLGLSKEDKKAIINHLEIKQLIKDRIEEAQSELTHYEKIITFILLDEPFSIDNKTLTNTLKIRRKFIETQYKTEIDSMYSSF